MRIKVDENLPVEVADLFRQAEHDAVTVGEQQHSGFADSNLASVLRQEQRALVTLDMGFADVRAYPPKEYAGLIVLRLRRQDKPYVLDVVRRLVSVMAAETPAGQLWIVGEHRIRARP
jgi:predicted nuclease of predicted toxin-antitoxin system